MRNGSGAGLEYLSPASEKTFMKEQERVNTVNRFKAVRVGWDSSFDELTTMEEVIETGFM